MSGIGSSDQQNVVDCNELRQALTQYSGFLKEEELEEYPFYRLAQDFESAHDLPKNLAVSNDLVTVHHLLENYRDFSKNEFAKIIYRQQIL